ncbi:hypothetical protein EST38_g2132 [Candolleomyces aberdarensis]|uniref:Major facilitator superfamily (MFS) profile domain-containing protein n=1 Tax=Candolleomyces aberdarensis TaxID=2316362 RepID=A0A4Q2DWR9_9AGAR|nr:hypothetical protein EST38_g2132 [Candolleomyces aberdarensis]
MTALIIARFMSGIGGGGINTTTSIITSDMFSARDRGLAQGFTSVFNALGLGLGGPLGGFISDKFGWRWAFLAQLPIFVISFALTEFNLNYTTEGENKDKKDILRRIDYAGTVTLFVAVFSLLVFMSEKFNDDLPWDHWSVILSLSLSVAFFILFVVAEVYVSPEPVLAPALFKHREAIVISASNFFVPICNYAVMYFLPTWFQTVKLDSASVAGAHIMPHSVAMSTGSIFAGWIMRRTGEYKLLMLIAGFLPFIAGVLFSTMTVNSPWYVQWFSIIPFGFGNACVLQTTLSALLASIPRKTLAVGTGFIQLFRGIGQVIGVALASAVFQAVLNVELHKRITGPGAEDDITRIRRDSTLVAHLPPDLQSAARESYAIGLRWVFIVATICTGTAYCIRLTIRSRSLDEPVEEEQRRDAESNRATVATNSSANSIRSPASSSASSVVEGPASR